jgi:hypothetical protein
MRAYEGGCHCGAVRFRVEVKDHRVLECTCSICRKKGFVHLIVPKRCFSLLRGDEALTTYRFNTGVAKHTFCRTCGIHSFYTPRSHPDAVDINVRCLDGDVIGDFSIERFDGDKWEENIGTIAHLAND